jgi:UDP-N-acetylmuramate dehydrogenase
MKLDPALLRGEFKENHLLANYTTWKVGGEARYFYQPADLQDLTAFLINLPRNKDIVWLGGGSNVLIRDGGIKDPVICLRNKLGVLKQEENATIYVQGGVSIARLVQYGVQLGLPEIAFLAGIPGTIGGALAMNAGAYGDEIWNHVISVETINRNGEIKTKTKADFSISYREVSGLNQEWFISARLIFPQVDKEQAKLKVREFLNKRCQSQPLSELSCGSVFKNPPNDYAARLIEACNLKGHKIGGARVSEKHANFIINDGTAKAVEIESLITLIKNEVQGKFGTLLENEVRILGEAK